MTKFLKVVCSLLLLLNAVSAFYGGINLIMDPTGISIGMPTGFLENLPFKNYFIPGIILLAVNGLSSLIITGLILFNHKFHPHFIFFQGFISLGWIVVQVSLIRSFSWLQVIYGGIGLMLFVFGFVLLTKSQPQKLIPQKNDGIVQ